MKKNLWIVLCAAVAITVAVAGGAGPVKAQPPDPPIEDLIGVAAFEPWPSSSDIPLRVVVEGDHPEIFINVGVIEKLGLSGQITIKVTEEEKGYREDGTIMVPRAVLFGELNAVFWEASLFVSKEILLSLGSDPEYVEYYEREILAREAATWGEYDPESGKMEDEEELLEAWKGIAESYYPLVVVFQDGWFGWCRGANWIPGMPVLPPASSSKSSTPVGARNVGVGLVALGLVVYGMRRAFKFVHGRKEVAEGVTRESLEAVLAVCKAKLDRIEQVGAQIPQESIRERIEQILLVSGRILESLRRDPQDLILVRRYLSSYLDSVLQILIRYTELLFQSTPSARGTLRKVPVLMEEVVSSLRDLHGRILRNDVRDLDAEIEAFRQRIALDGFTTKEKKKGKG